MNDDVTRKVQEALIAQLREALPDIPIYTGEPMSENERKTHFQGFARLSYPELDHYFKMLYVARLERDTRQIEQIENIVKQALAERAYDLVFFLIDKAPYYSGSFDAGYGTPDEIREVIEHLPDLTAWPTTEPPPTA